MTVVASQIVVLAVGGIVCLLSAWGIFVPKRLVRVVANVMERKPGIYVAIVVRVLLGLALIICASSSRFPHVFEVLGWIAIVAAVGLAVMGRARLHRFVAWFERFPDMLIRLWLLFGFAFGGFLVYGVS